MTPDETLELLRSAVMLRIEGRKVPESVRRALAHTETKILGVVGPLVRKRIAAQLLGCSVQALDRHVAAGSIAVEPVAAGAVRMAIPTSQLVDIAVAKLQHGVRLGAAIDLARERRNREIEMSNASNLIKFATWTAHASWERQHAS